ERLEDGLRSAPASAAPAPAAAAAASAPEPETARPPSEAATPQAAPPAALGLDTAITSWPAVLDLVREKNSMLATALAAARPVAVGERERRLALPGGACCLKRKAEQDEHRPSTGEAPR